MVSVAKKKTRWMLQNVKRRRNFGSLRVGASFNIICFFAVAVLYYFWHIWHYFFTKLGLYHKVNLIAENKYSNLRRLGKISGNLLHPQIFVEWKDKKINKWVFVQNSKEPLNDQTWLPGISQSYHSSWHYTAESELFLRQM